MEAIKNINKNNNKFELNSNEHGYGICIRCRSNAGPLCDKCFIILRKLNLLKNKISILEIIYEIDE